MEWYEKCKEIGVNSVLFRFDYPRELFISEDLLKSRDLIQRCISSNGELSIIGEIGIGKTYIKRDFLNRYKNSEIKIIEPVIFSESCRIYDIYESIVNNVNQSIKPKWKLVDREPQAMQVLEDSEFEKFVIVIDNSQSLKKELIDLLLEFKKKVSVPLSVIFIGTSINTNKNLEEYRLSGLNEEEKRKYFSLINEKVSTLLPYSIPIEVVKGCNTYFEIREKYVDYAWKVKKGIIRF